MATSSLGRGFDALLSPTNAPDHSAENKELSIALLKPNPWQPRLDFREESLQELADSIKKQGIIQPLLVRQIDDETYQIIAGERRYRAAKLAGLATVPVFVRSMNDEEVMAAALIENLQREDLNPMEEALGLKTLRETLNLTQEAIAEKLGRSRSSIANSLRLLQLSQAAQDDIRSGAMTAGHARNLLAIADEELAESLRLYIIDHNLSVREVEDLISQWKKTGQPSWVNSDNGDGKKAPQEKKGRLKKSAIAKKMQTLISQIMACEAKVMGDEEQGKITLSYSSSEELHNILEKIGASNIEEAEEGVPVEENLAEENAEAANA